MNNNYLPLDNKYTFRRLLHALYTSQVSNAFLTQNPNSMYTKSLWSKF